MGVRGPGSYIYILYNIYYIRIYIYIDTYSYCYFLDSILLQTPLSLWWSKTSAARCSASGLSGNVFGRLKKHFEDAARR